MGIPGPPLARDVEGLVTALAAVPAALMITDLSGLVRWANDIYAEMTGYSAQEIAGRNAGELASGAYRQGFGDIARRVLASGKPWTGGAECRRKNGEPYAVEDTAAPIKGAGGKITHFLWSRRAIGATQQRGLSYRDLPLPYQSLDAGGCLIDVNDEWLEQLGYLREDVAGHWFGEFLAPESVDPFREAFPKFKADGVIHHAVLELVRKDGTHLVVSFEGNVSRDRDGQFLQSHCVWQDITPRQETERALRNSEERYRGLIDVSPDSIFVLSPDGVVLAAYPKGDLIPNSPAGGYVGATQEQLFPPASAQRHKRSVRHVADTGNTLVTEECLGGKRWIETRLVPIRSDGGSVTSIMGISRDISDRKETESRIRSHNERLRRIVEQTDAAYFRIGTDGCYEEVNSAWLRMHGFSGKSEIIGKHFSMVQAPEDLGRAEEIVRKVLGGERLSSEFSRLNLDGSTGYHSFSAHPVFDGDTIAGLEGFLIDLTAPRRAEEGRREIEKRYRSLFDSMQEGVAIHKLISDGDRAINYVILDVNRRYEELIGIHREDAVNRVAAEVYGTEAPPYLSEYANVVKTQQAGHFETYFPPMDKHFAISIAPMGRDLFATIFFDITERFHAIDRLQERSRALASEERRHRLLFNSVDDAIFVHGIEPGGLPGRFFEVNDVACRRLGYTREELLQMGPLDIDDPGTAASIPGVMGRLVSQNRITWEGVHVTRDGRRIPVEMNAHLFDMDGAPTVLSSARDITERKRSEQALRDRDATIRRLAAAIEQAGEQVLITDVDGRIQYSNPAFEKVTGYLSSEVVGQTPRVLNSGKHTREFYEDLWATISDGKVWTGRFTNQKKDGSLYEEDATISPISDASGRTTGFVAVKRDATERLQLESQLRQAQKMESVGRLAGGVAHDFNNLLTVINGYAELLSNRLAAEDPLLGFAGQIRKAGERAASLTRQLLAFSRKQIIEPKAINLNSVIKDSEHMIRSLIGEDIDVLTELDPSLGQVMADPDQLHQVLMNLVVNARDAMPGGGTLVIETSNVDLDGGYAAAHSDATPGRRVLLSVKDTGVGMDEATRQSIFEPFFTTKEVGKGTGLGLSTVYGIVRQSGGWISVHSAPGEGATFKIYLPRTDAGVRDESEVVRSGTGLDGWETVLVAEDNENVRTLAAAVLTARGYQVLEAEDGVAAYAMAREHSGVIHLLLTDVVLPGVNGKELADRLNILRPDTKVLYMSGYAEDVIAQSGILQAGIAFLSKPFSPDGLAAKVREVLTRPAPAQPDNSPRN